MALPRKLLAWCGATLAATAFSIAQDPVPTRVHADPFGSASGSPLPLDVSLDFRVDREHGTRLRMNDAAEGALAIVVLGLREQQTALPYGATLWVDPLVTLPFVVGPSHAIEIPLGLADRSFADLTLFAQAVQFRPTPERFQATAAVALAVTVGNPQPPLFYVGPPFTLTPVANATRIDEGRMEILTAVEVPTSGWVLDLQAVARAGDLTKVYLVLDEPAPDEYVMPVMETRRLVVDLGPQPSKTVQFLVERRVRGLPTLPAFLLAAEVRTDF